MWKFFFGDGLIAIINNVIFKERLKNVLAIDRY